MRPESASRFEALEAQAETIMAVFRAAGYERVAPAILQPAGVFLDRVGEDIRSRTYVFTDLDGEELCLRPDLTVPVCRIYLDRDPQAAAPARYAYNGPAFRYQAGAPNPLRPREFRQAGIESFGEADALSADIGVFATTWDAMRAAGLSSAAITIGDVGLFRALVRAMPIADWRRNRLLGAFWRGDALPRLLSRMTEPHAAARTDLAPVLDRIDPDAPEKAADVLREHLDQTGAPFIGARTAEEIAARLVIIKADMAEPPLPAAYAEALRAYLAFAAPANEAAGRIAALARAAGLDVSHAAEALEARVDALTAAGFSGLTFSSDLGRRFEYYTGFVFEMAAAEENPPPALASGGRYDGLLAALGAPCVIPAVGAAIHTERLLAAVKGAP
ncbi:MAG: ATP phosphoribosyltransferase regulatory subunit [Hyphomicrobiales bacterium]|nr:ATP phosphoribosyltransferase regulatory subunit [Hyphomicrobiales bacterium]